LLRKGRFGSKESLLSTISTTSTTSSCSNSSTSNSSSSTVVSFDPNIRVYRYYELPMPEDEEGDWTNWFRV
jgi:hypothetical protein